MLNIAIIQLQLDDRESRAERIRRVEEHFSLLAGEAVQPQVVVLPEIWATGFFNFDRYHRESEPLDGEIFSMLAPWAEKIGCYIVGGSIIEQGDQAYYNTSLVIDPTGSLAGTYRKIHLFGYQAEESRLLQAGKEPLVLKTEFGTWGFSTCYDLRFPELYRFMVDGGTDLFFVVAAWPRARLEHWVLLNRTRALENLGNLCACNCSGTIRGTELGGNSLVVDPWGEVKARGGLQEEIIRVDVNPGLPGAVRRKFPALSDRRLR